MTVPFQWTTHHLANCCYAAAGFSRGLQPVEETLGEALLEPCAEMQRQVAACEVPAAKFWEYLLAFAHQADNAEALVRVVLTKTAGIDGVRAFAVTELARALAQIIAATADVLPKLDEELQHRIRPLQAHWEARGPGLLKAIARLTDERLLVEETTIIAVYPTFGGGGVANLLTNSVVIEAVLANVLPELPEVVRLGWLIAQLNHDLPIFSEAVRDRRIAELAQLALLPPTLQASAEVELAALSPTSIANALAGWRVNVAAGEDLAERLLNWWGTYCETKPPWSVALAALDRMLSS